MYECRAIRLDIYDTKDGHVNKEQIYFNRLFMKYIYYVIILTHNIYKTFKNVTASNYNKYIISNK